jgi:protein-tyrosine phosphatase
MTSLYQQLAVDGSPEFASALRQIVEGHLPIVYHCTAGKDRTGLFSAILLRILGVKPDIIKADYLLSNQYLLAPELVARTQASLRAAMPETPSLSPEALHVLLGVDQKYLDAAFAAIDQKFGSFDNYRREALGVSDQNAAALRDLLLNP